MPKRKMLVAMLALGAVILGAIGVGTYFWAIDEIRSRHPGTEVYTQADQEKAARFIVDGLNTHDPKRVWMIYVDGVPDRAANIAAAIPPPDCHYSLNSVRDRGEQGAQEIYGHLYHSTRRFDMLLAEICAGKAATDRTIGVISTAWATEWIATALVPER